MRLLVWGCIQVRLVAQGASRRFRGAGVPPRSRREDRCGCVRDTRLAWGCVAGVAAGARMWRLIRLHRVAV